MEHAYFNGKYKVIAIYLSHYDKIYYPPKSGSDPEWEHAKWAWKVSVTVAIFLVDYIAHLRFRTDGF